MGMQMIFKTLVLDEVTENVRVKKEDIRSNEGLFLRIVMDSLFVWKPQSPT